MLVDSSTRVQSHVCRCTSVHPILKTIDYVYDLFRVSMHSDHVDCWHRDRSSVPSHGPPQPYCVRVHSSYLRSRFRMQTKARTVHSAVLSVHGNRPYLGGT